MMKNLHILAILPNSLAWGSPAFLAGGGHIRTVEILKRWHKWGISVETLEDIQHSVSLHSNAPYFVHKIDLSLLGKNFRNRFLLFLIWGIKSITFLLKKIYFNKKFDVIITTEGIALVPFGVLASKILRVPLVVSIQTTNCAISFSSAYKQWRNRGWSILSSLLKTLGDRITIGLLKKASVLICLSDPIARMLKTMGIPEQRIFINGMGIDEKCSRDTLGSSIESKEYDTAFLGRVEREKGVDDLLEAWKIVIGKMKDAKLLIIGSGNYMGEAKTYVEKLGMNKNVRFTCYIVGDEKYRYLRKSKIFVFPTKAEEGWGLAVGEALACGLPVVCYDNPVLVSVFGNCKSVIFVQAGDVKKLADAILWLLENEGLLNQYSKISREYAKQFDWNEVARRELEIVKKL